MTIWEAAVLALPHEKPPRARHAPCRCCGESHDPRRITCAELAEIRAAERRAWDPNP